MTYYIQGHITLGCVGHWAKQMSIAHVHLDTCVKFHYYCIRNVEYKLQKLVAWYADKLTANRCNPELGI